MGAKVHELALPGGGHYSWVFRCPACKSQHQCDNRWGFNGDVEHPTFTGSVLVYAVDHGTPDAPVHRPRCHAQVTDGRISYYADSTHALAGQTVDLPDWHASTHAESVPHESVDACSPAPDASKLTTPMRPPPTDTPMPVEVPHLGGVTIRHPSK